MSIQGTIFGRLGRDPETRTAGQNTVTSFSVACDHFAGKGKGSNGGDKTTTWVNVSVWGPRGSALQTRLKKGKRVVATGELFERPWTDKAGVAQKSIDLDAKHVDIVDWDDAPPASAGSSAAPVDNDIPY